MESSQPGLQDSIIEDEFGEISRELFLVYEWFKGRPVIRRATVVLRIGAQCNSLHNNRPTGELAASSRVARPY